MCFWVYLLDCADRTIYVGYTDDLDRRMAEHHSGEFPGYTSSRRPLVCLWTEEFSTREEAKTAESKLKGWSAPKKRALAAGDWNELKRVSKSRNRAERLGGK